MHNQITLEALPQYTYAVSKRRGGLPLAPVCFALSVLLAVAVTFINA